MGACGFPKRFGDGIFVAQFQRKTQIAAGIVPHQGGAVGHGVGDGEGMGQWLVVDRNEFGGAFGLIQGFRHDKRDAVTGMANLIGAQNRMKRTIGFRSAHILGHAFGRKSTEPIRLGVGTGEDQQHTGGGEGLGGVDAANFRMGMGRTDHPAVNQAGQLYVVDKPTAPGHQPRILGALHRLTDTEFCHSTPSPS